MKINNLKINAFGKLEDKEFNFTDGINLIISENEAGKTTLTKCIQGMFFGISRNKNKKSISDYEKYKPWSNNLFTAKLNYTLDNGEYYEIYRDFTKRNTKIFNSKSEDISGEYGIDKYKNSTFFTEQTNISEDVFMKTAIMPQQEIILNSTEQNILLQKTSNLISTGDDTVSFNKVLDKLTKKQLDEVGTNRSTGKPINIVTNKINEYNTKLADIDYIKSKEETNNTEITNLQLEIKNLENDLSLLKELINIKNNEKINNNQIEVMQNFIDEYTEKINSADEDIKKIKKQNSSKKKIGIIFSILLILYSAIIFILKLPLPLFIISGILFILAIYFLLKNIPIPDTKDVLVNAKKEKEAELEKLILQCDNINLSSKEYIRGKYGSSPYVDLTSEEIANKLAETEQEYSKKNLLLNTLSIHNKSVSNQIEELATIEEELDELNEKLDELNFINNSINIAKEALNEAYEEMKNNITPEFTKYLSSTIATISNNKYTEVQFNDKDGLIVELPSGDYINAELLSLGTLDQMYISLRLAALKEISKEELPIILDESFVYFDDARLKNILKFLSAEFKQIIIFSCSNREKNLLNELKINYTEHTL